ncbi:hypothetical protein ACHIPZ_17790 [Antrihabitans sp. NCIMB 15449]|uniref:FXSXX-COOH protein n=2 Tax=Antrihabitans spumae TaxID=3373370 RepID=A0ABW7JQG5_9NOCA
MAVRSAVPVGPMRAPTPMNATVIDLRGLVATSPTAAAIAKIIAINGKPSNFDSSPFDRA